jgi:hypothetical protein
MSGQIWMTVAVLIGGEVRHTLHASAAFGVVVVFYRVNDHHLLGQLLSGCLSLAAGFLHITNELANGTRCLDNGSHDAHPSSSD